MNVSARQATKLDIDAPQVDWSRDGSRVALASQAGGPASPTPLIVLDRDGVLLWSRMIDTFSPNPRWSADGTLLSVQIEEPSGEPSGARIDRLEIYDATTGATRYRVQGAIACQGPIWVGDSHRLLSEFYFNPPPGSALIDLDAQKITRLSSYNLTPMPFDSTHAISSGGGGWTLIDLTTDTETAIADTTVNATWDPLHANQPLFAGKRLFFTAQHGGHGGCAEGASPSNPPQLKLEVGPFTDDAPVTRSP